MSGLFRYDNGYSVKYVTLYYISIFDRNTSQASDLAVMYFSVTWADQDFSLVITCSYTLVFSQVI